MMRRILVVSLAAGSIGLSSVLAQPKPAPAPAADSTGTAPAPTTAAPAAAPTTAADPEQDARRAQVVVRFEGGTMTVGDLEDELARQSTFVRRRFVAEPTYRKEFVERLVRFELLARESERRKFGESDEVQGAVKQNAVQAMLRSEFDEKLTVDTIPLEDVEAYYESQAHEYKRPAMVRASHILVADAKTAAKLLEEAAKADLREFRRLAREHSIDEQTKLRGGDLRYFDASGRAKGQEVSDVPDGLVKAAFTLKNVGDVFSKPIETEAGYSILKLTGRRPADIRGLEDAETSIRLRLWRQQRQEAVERFVDKLRQQIAPKLHPELIEQIRINTEPPGAGLTPGFPHAAPPTDEKP